MNNTTENTNYRLSKRVMCLILSLLIAFGTFVTMTFGNLFLSDYVNLHNLIVANALAPKPLFYRYGELVGLYKLNYGNTSTIYYKIGENGEWTEYSVPFTIPAYESTTVYARFGTDGVITYDDFTNTDKAIGVYYESATDFDFSYNGINFGYTRIYNSADKNWFESIHSKVITVGSLLKVYLPDGTEYPLVRTGDYTYVDEITGKTLTKANGEYVFDDGDYKYHFAINLLNSVAYLSGIEDNNGNSLDLTRTTNTEEASITDGTRTFAVSDYEAVEATNDPDVQYYSVKTITDPNENDIEYTTKWGRYIQVMDQAGVTLGSYQYVNTASDYTMTRSNDKAIEYYTDGRLKKITYDNGSWIQYTYDDSDMEFTTLTSAGETTCTVYNDAFLPVSYTDEFGDTTAYTYDSHYRVLTETTGNETTTYTYDANGNISSYITNDSESNTYYTYDSNNRIVREQVGSDYTYYTYDSNGNNLVYATLNEDYTGTAPALYDSTLTCFDTTTYTYDSSGRVTSEVYGEGGSVSYTYDSYGNVLTETTVDAENNQTSVTYTYDAFGNVLSSTEGNDTSSYTYDAAGRLLLSNEAGECTRTLYDDMGRIVQEIDPEDYDSTKEGLPTENTYDDSTAGHRYVYDSTTGNLVSETNRLGIETTYTYYSTGEKQSEEFDIYEFDYNIKGDITDIYVDNVNTLTYNYNALYQLMSKVYANGQSIRYAYDNDGNLVAQYHNNDSTAFVTYTYDQDGELIEKVNIDTGLRYEYDGDDVEVYKISNNTLIHSYSEQVGENSTTVTQSNFGTATTSVTAGNTVSYTTGNNTAEYSCTKNGNNQITADDLKYNNVSVQPSTYDYDNAGNVTGKEIGFSYDNENESVDILLEYNHQRISGFGYGGNIDIYYYYDDNGQLERVDAEYPFKETRGFTYDSRGNITSKTQYHYTTGSLENATTEGTKSFSYASTGWTDKLLSVDNDSLTYDAVGNVLTYGNRSFTWSSGRNLASITESNNTYSYTYDENGIRTSKTVNGNTTYFNTKDGVILSQSDGTNTLVFQYDQNGNPTGFTLNGTQYFYMTNITGDVIGLTDEGGEIFAEYAYDEWGELVGQYTYNNDLDDVVQLNPIRYRGYYYDVETGYYYLQSRYYDPTVSRFINADAPEIAQSSKEDYVGQNIFVYCFNDPVNESDCFGYGKNIYVFLYYHDSKNNLYKQAKNSVYYYYYSKNVIAYGIDDVQTLANRWNNMKNPYRVYLFLHGSCGKLYFGGEGNSATSQKVYWLCNFVTVKDKVYLFSCEGGAGNNNKKMANTFAKLSGTVVYALPVGVSYGFTSDRNFYARTQSKYYNLTSFENIYWHKYWASYYSGAWHYRNYNTKLRDLLY